MLDARAGVDFAGAHLAGSLNIGLDGSYATWAGTLLDHERPIVIVVEPGREQEAALRLGRIGFDNVAGYLDGGMLALADRPDLVERIERITPATLVEQLAEPDPPLVARRPHRGRARAAVVEGSVNIPLGHLAERLGRAAARPADRRPLLGRLPLLDRRELCCSATASSDVTDLVGGLSRSIRRAVSSISLSSVFQLRAVPATPSDRSNQSSVSFVRPEPFG